MATVVSYRIQLKTLLLVGAVILFQGCTKPYNVIMRQYRAAPASASLAGISAEPLKVGETKSLTIGDGSPLFVFDGGRSYFRIFKLPEGPYPYKVTVSSYPVGGHLKSAYIFSPRLLTLDDNYRTVRVSLPQSFGVEQSGMGEALQEAEGLRQKLQGGLNFSVQNSFERYLVVLTTDDLLLQKTSMSAGGEVPMYIIGAQSAKPTEVQIPNAPAGRIRIEVPKDAGDGIISDLNAAGAAGDSDHPENMTLRMAGGRVIGTVILGKSTEDSVRELLRSAGVGFGTERRVSQPVASDVRLPPMKKLITPPGTSYQMEFDEKGVLVMVADSHPAGIPLAAKGFIAAYPTARETGRTFSSYELQAPISPCVKLIADFHSADDTLDSAGYSYSCH